MAICAAGSVPSGGSATPTAITYSDSLGLQGTWNLGAIAPDSRYDGYRNFLGFFSTMNYTVYGSSSVRTFEYGFPLPEPTGLSILAVAAVMALRRRRPDCMGSQHRTGPAERSL
jgi:hypothetical protein